MGSGRDAGAVLGYTGMYWGSAGIYWDKLGCCAEGRGPSKPPGAEQGQWGALAALKQALQLAHAHLWGGQRCPGSLRDGHEGISWHFLCQGRQLLGVGGIQLNPKPSALKGKEKALCSHG